MGEKEQEKADQLAAAKVDTPENAPGGPVTKAVKPKAPTPVSKDVMDFVPPELAGAMEPPAHAAESDFVPPELMGDMGGAAVGGGGDFVPPELQGDMGGA